MRLIPNELVRKNTEHANSSSTTRALPMFKLFESLVNHIYKANYHMNSTHVQTRWPVALCLPTNQRTRVSFMWQSDRVNVITDEYLRMMSSCDDRSIDIVMREGNTMLDGTLIWLRHSGYERLNGVELMCTTSKGASAQIFKKEQHIICYIGGNNYPGFLRFCTALPLIYGDTPDPQMEDLMLHWVKWADAKIDDYGFEQYLDNMPLLRELQKQAQLNELRTKMQELTKRTVSELQQRESSLLADMSSSISHYTDLMRAFTSTQEQLSGALATLDAKTVQLQDFLDVMLRNPFIKKVSFENNKLTITISTPLLHFNEDFMAAMVAPGKKYGDSPYKEIYTALFLSGDYQIWMCADMTLPMFGANLHGTYNKDANKTAWGLPNLHLYLAHCLGNNAPQILRAAQNEDYMLMLSYCISAVGNINLFDSTIWAHFARAIGGDLDYANYSAVEDVKTKQRYNFGEFRTLIERRIQETERATAAVHDNAGRTGVDTEPGTPGQGHPANAAQPATPGEQAGQPGTEDRGAVRQTVDEFLFDDEDEDDEWEFERNQVRQPERINDDITEAVAQGNREVEDETN